MNSSRERNLARMRALGELASSISREGGGGPPNFQVCSGAKAEDRPRGPALPQRGGTERVRMS
jgi:hypothetical protein